MNRTFLIAALALTGCAKEPELAPKKLSDLGAALFRNFEAEDTTEYEFDLLTLQGLLLEEDFSLDAKDRAVTLPVLKGDDLGELSIPNGADPELQVNRALSGQSKHAVETQRQLHVEANQVCIESSSTIWAGRDFLSDKACWADGSCDRLETLTEVRKENILAKVWYDQFKTYRAFTLEDEDGNTYDAIVGRAWIEEVFPGDNGNNSWDQLFQIDVMITDPDKPGESLRWFGMWSSITLGGLGDDAYGNLVVDGIAEAYIYGDEFIDGNIETCTNDRGLAKPDRN